VLLAYRWSLLAHHLGHLVEEVSHPRHLRREWRRRPHVNNKFCSTPRMDDQKVSLVHLARLGCCRTRRRCCTLRRRT
jgi:hypothetical protein